MKREACFELLHFGGNLGPPDVDIQGAISGAGAAVIDMASNRLGAGRQTGGLKVCGRSGALDLAAAGAPRK